MSEREKRAFAHKILDLVLDINGTNKRQKEIVGELPTAFFSFFGHTSEVEWYILPTGYDEEEFKPIRCTTYLERLEKEDAKKVIEKLEDLKKEVLK